MNSVIEPGVLDYGANYYRSHCGPIPYDRSHPHWAVFFGGIAETLIRSFRPARVFDVGCAMGFLVEAFWDRGVEAWGRDISEFAISQVRADLRGFCSVGSATAPIEGRYDLITCIEVLEHMPEQEAVEAIRAMTKATDRILFSSSPTDLDEPTHVNVKPTIYWLRLFAAEGFGPLMSYDPTFVTPHCVVLERDPEKTSESILLGFAEIVRLRLQQASRDETIRSLFADVKRTELEAVTAQEEIIERDATIAELKCRVERLDQAKKDLDQAKKDLDQAKKDLDQAKKDLDQARRDLDQARRDLDQAIRNKDDASRQSKKLRVTHATLQTEYQRVVTSTSWRMTWPLRKIAANLPKGVRRFFRRALIAIWWTLTFQLWARLKQRRRMAELALAKTASRQQLAPRAQRTQTDTQGYLLSPEELAADKLPWMKVLRLIVDPDLSSSPRLNVLVPGLALKHMSGGPNTAVNIACRLAASGVAVRLVATSAPLDPDPTSFWAHAAALSETDPLALGMELVDTSTGQPFRIGENDLFMATAWWTAQAAKYAVRHTKHKRFIYLIQDYESLLHPASTEQALAEETYQLDHIPVINTTLLRDFLVQNGVGRFADPDFATAALVFEPAIDTKLFYPVTRHSGERRKRLLFYARPTNGLRNLFDLGVSALRTLIATGGIDHESWEFCGMGEAFAPIDLGQGCTLQPLPWKDLATYAEQVRESDVLLSCMLSPHPSYPPLEMAASGRPVVTTTFGNKTADRLRQLSPNIIGVEPTLEALAEGLREAIRRTPNDTGIDMPTTWSVSLDGAIRSLGDRMLKLDDVPIHDFLFDGTGKNAVFPGFDFWPVDQYGIYRRAMVADRVLDYTDADPGLLSFITPVWNTAPKFLLELAETVFGQDSGSGFEWVIVDNGSSDESTREAINAIAKQPNVRVFRVEENIGIVPALRMALEQARHRYIVPLDSDDLLTPDCVRIMTSALRAAGFPKLAYSDEDMELSGHPRNPYSKPDWDPVLFTHSCYIAHLCAIDREMALELGCYTDTGAQGSSDWDTFTRFMTAGHAPLHVPEIVYTWRMHPLSTSMNMGSKSYIHDSQRTVLQRFLASRPNPERYSIELSPLFDNTPDWRFVRAHDAPRAITTLLYGGAGETGTPQPASSGHQVVRLATFSLNELLEHARAAASEGRYLHLLSADVRVEDESWADEALAMFELYPDTVIVGGRIHRDGIIVSADAYFGVDGPCSSPNIGRSIKDPGYAAQLLKPHSCNAVPVEHCVVDPEFLQQILPDLIAMDIGLVGMAAWLGAAARKSDRRCIYSPFFIASRQSDVVLPPSIDVAAFALRYADLIPEKALFSPRLGLTRETAYQPILRPARAKEERTAREVPGLSYQELHAAERKARYSPVSLGQGREVSVLTNIYIGTDAALFRETASSLLTQTLPVYEWIILAQGPITPATELVLSEVSRDARVKVLRRGTNLGIIGGLRVCLEAATGRLILPLDADDLLTPDAVQLITAAFIGPDPVTFAFSDEDILLSGELRSPIRRRRFDPILNDEDSTIWHLCVFDRETALRLGVYSDPGAEFAQDWDTVQRFASNGEVIRHVPHVLYHWRHHPASTSGSGSVNRGSIESVRHILSRIRDRQARPELYEVRPYPIFRGAEQLALMRRRSQPLALCLIYLARESGSVSQQVLDLPGVNEVHMMQADGPDLATSLAAVFQQTVCTHAVLLREGLLPCNDDGPWDAMRLFEMHADVAACGGRILDQHGHILSSCSTLASGESGWRDRTRTDPGEHALLLKAQTAAGLAEGYLFCTVPVLSEAAHAIALEEEQSLTRAIERVTVKQGLRLGYSPLIEATVVDVSGGGPVEQSGRRS